MISTPGGELGVAARFPAAEVVAGIGGALTFAGFAIFGVCVVRVIGRTGPRPRG